MNKNLPEPLMCVRHGVRWHRHGGEGVISSPFLSCCHQRSQKLDLLEQKLLGNPTEHTKVLCIFSKHPV